MSQLEHNSVLILFFGRINGNAVVRTYNTFYIGAPCKSSRYTNRWFSLTKHFQKTFYILIYFVTEWRSRTAMHDFQQKRHVMYVSCVKWHVTCVSCDMFENILLLNVFGANLLLLNSAVLENTGASCKAEDPSLSTRCVRCECLKNVTHCRPVAGCAEPKLQKLHGNSKTRLSLDLKKDKCEPGAVYKCVYRSTPNYHKR